MSDSLNVLLKAGGVPNVVVRNKITNQRVILFAVHFNNELVLLGPVANRDRKDWLEKCWVLDKAKFKRNYELE